MTKDEFETLVTQVYAQVVEAHGVSPGQRKARLREAMERVMTEKVISLGGVAPEADSEAVETSPKGKRRGIFR